MPDQPTLMTVSEVAAYLHISQETVRRMLRSHKLPGNRLGPGRMGWRIKLADVEQLLRDSFSEKG